MKETMKEVQAFLLALKAKPFPVDLVALNELIGHVNAELSALDFWHGVPCEFCYAYSNGGDVVFLPVERNYITPDCVVYIRRGDVLFRVMYGYIEGMREYTCVGVRT